MRLLTRSDFDGLACGVLLREAGVIHSYKFVHPKDIQDGKIPVSENDVLANVPFMPGCGLWFDHHSSEEEVRNLMQFDFKGVSDDKAPSCARIIYDYYGGKEKFPHFDAMMEIVDRSDSGRLTREEVLEPTGWVLLSFIMDPRTGLGRYKDYRISNYTLMEQMIEYCRTKSIEEILEVEDVVERVKRYHEQVALYTKMIQDNSEVYGNVLVIDLRDVDEIVTGNRFMEYTLYPDQNISMRVIWGVQKQNVVITVGHSILNRTSKTDVGHMLLEYNGGGHRQVGTCQVPTDRADDIISELIKKMRTDG